MADIWTEFESDRWSSSILDDSVFKDLYEATTDRISDVLKVSGYDCVVDVGCGTGDIIGNLEGVNLPRIGVDINPSFVSTCRHRYGHQDQPAEFHLADATSLSKWWAKSGLADLYSAPLVVCCNNTIMIMPETIRDEVMQECRKVAGPDGRTLVTFWNGRMFAHGVMGYYKKNPALCGTFDLTPKCIDWQGRNFRSHSGYSSTWLMADEVAQWMQAMGIPVIVVERESRGTIEENHVCEEGMGIFVWTKGLDWHGTRSRNVSNVSVISTTTDHSHRSDDRSDGSITEGGPSQGGDGDVDGDGDVSFDMDGNEELT